MVWMGLVVKKKILPQLVIKAQSLRQHISFDPAFLFSATTTYHTLTTDCKLNATCREYVNV